MDKSSEKPSGSEPSKEGGARKTTPRTHFLPPRKDAPKSQPASESSDESQKGNRLQEILSFRKTGFQPKHVFAEDRETAAPAASAPVPSAPSPAATDTWMEKVELYLWTLCDSLIAKSASSGKLQSALLATKRWLFEKEGLRAILQHRFVTQFLPPADTQWTWKSFLFTRGLERTCFLFLLIFLSFGFYTCGNRAGEQKKHSVLLTPQTGTDFDTRLESFQNFLALRNKGNYAQAYDILLNLKNKSDGMGGIDRHLGETLILLGQGGKAQSYLEDAITKNDSASDAHAIIATMAHTLPGNIISIVPPDQLAENHFRKSIEKDPSNVTAYILWGIFLETQGKYEQALKKFEQSQMAEQSKVTLNMREILAELCRYKLQMPTGQNPGTASYYFVQALRAFDNNAPTEAVAALAKAHGMVTPDIFNTMLANPLFVDHVIDAKIKPLLDAALSGGQPPAAASPSPASSASVQ